MGNNNSGKYRALFGVLLVFIIPFVLITGVYLLPKPKHKKLPKVAEPVSFNLKQFGDLPVLLTFNEDIKVVVDTTKDGSSMLKNVYKKTLTYPKRTFKEPHSKILFIYADDTVNDTTNLKHQLYLPKQDLHTIFAKNNKLNQNILLLDQNDQIRGVYNFSAKDISALNIDIQHLMVETLMKNSEDQRIFK